MTARATWDGAHVVLEVEDTGVGIAEGDLGRIFDDFERTSAPITQVEGGTGLGLAVAYRLCEVLGATLHATSTVGCGSTFTVRLPREAPAGP